MSWGCSRGYDASVDSSHAKSDVLTNGHPGVVAIIRAGEVYCSGCVVSPNTVLTAAHCIVGARTSSIQVFLGLDVRDEGETLNTTGFTVHPDFDLDTFQYDLAIPDLERSVSILPLRAFSADTTVETVWPGVATFVGFGSTSLLTTNSRQRTGTSRVDVSTRSSFRLIPGPDLPCAGDSGGAVLLSDGDSDLLIGIVSHGMYRASVTQT